MIYDYVGIRYDIQNRAGLNCWGLVALVYQDILNKTVNAFDVDNHRQAIRLFNDAFIKNTHGLYKVEAHKDYDIIILKKGKHWHCGIVHENYVLHASSTARQVIYQRLNDVIAEFEECTFWRK